MERCISFANRVSTLPGRERAPSMVASLRQIPGPSGSLGRRPRHRRLARQDSPRRHRTRKRRVQVDPPRPGASSCQPLNHGSTRNETRADARLLSGPRRRFHHTLACGFGALRRRA